MKQKILLKTMLLLCALVVGSSNVWADEDDTHDFTQTLSQLLNNGADIADISIPAQSYTVKEVIISYTHNKSLTGDFVTASVSVGGDSWGSTMLTCNSTTTQSFSSSSTNGAIVISFTNPRTGTKQGTFQVTNVRLVEGSASSKVAQPTFYPAAGAVEAGTEVTISSATDGATIYYTMGATPADPTTSSTEYTGPITINEATTIKAIAVKDEMTNSNIGSASYTIKEVVHGYAIDFEKPIDAYVDWTINNIGIHTSGLTAAHSGSAWGSNVNSEDNGVATANIQTKEKVANPGIFTCYISKESSNTTASSWKIQVSSNGTDWTDIASLSSMTQNTWTELKGNIAAAGYTNVYVRLYYNGSTAKRAVDDISLTLASSVPTPTFTVAEGTFYEAQIVKVDNYDSDYVYFYTTDGTTPDCDANLDPTGTSVEYDHATGVAISATTTLKIIAADIDGNKSSVASATYTIELPLTTIAAVKALSSGDTFRLNLTGAQVVFIDSAKKNIYVRDASGAIVLFNNSGFTTSLTTGDILSGVIEGKYSPYKNLPEIVNITDISVLTATDNTTVVAKTIAGTTEAIAANLCDLVKIENTEISETDSKYYVGESSDIQLYDNFSVGYTTTTGQAVDVSGIATVYNTTYEIFPRFETDVVYLANSEAVSIPSTTGYATFASANALDFTAVDAIKVFYATVSGSTLTFTQIKKVPANTGVLLVSAVGGAVAETHVPFLTDAADATTGNVFVKGTGAAVTYAENDQNYILFNGDDGVGFYKANNNIVATNRAYIHVDGGAGVKSFSINLDDDATAITEIAEKAENTDAIYNLAGQRLNKMQKGINIVNGKKILK